jgi:hypothetical protein
MSSPVTESAVLIAARQLADEALERSRRVHPGRRRVPGPGRLTGQAPRVPVLT